MAFEITYTSDLYPHSSILNTLAVFYDKIYLPHPYGVSNSCRQLWYNWEWKFVEDLDYVQQRYARWREENDLLFREGVIEQLPDLFELPGAVPDEIGNEIIRRFGTDHLDNYIFTRDDLEQKRVRMGKNFIVDGHLALALHFAYAKEPAPEFIWEPDLRFFSGWEHLSAANRKAPTTSTESIRNQVLVALLSYNLPLIPARAIDEVLEIRRKYEDERKGFSLFLNEVADEVENRLRNGIGLDEAALRTVERNIVPKFEEFRRKSKINRAGWFARVAKGFAEIDATFASPKFFFQLSKALFGAAIETAANESELASNKNQAFRFLARLSQK